jgi:hypothetical protein
MLSMFPTLRRSIAWCIVATVMCISLWLNARAGIALVFDLATGKKGCVNMLAQYVGMPEDDWRFGVVHAVSFLWIPIVVVGAVVLAVGIVRRVWRK